jgi:hypothetical protein
MPYKDKNREREHHIAWIVVSAIQQYYNFTIVSDPKRALL